MNTTDAAAARGPAPHAAPDSAREAMGSFARNFGALAALRLESCIHCGMCADVCHFYIATEDPRYTPVWKAEPFKQAYKRESGPFAPFFRLFGLKHKITSAELEEWQHLVYDSCNLCGRCSLMCPMGIDVAGLIKEAREGMFEAGLAPTELYQRAMSQHQTGSPDPSAAPSVEQLRAIGEENGVKIPLDQERADVMLCVSGIDIEHYPKQIVALSRVMDHLGVSWTFRSEALLAENYPYLAGARQWEADIVTRLVLEAEACGAGTVIVPECGHGYAALRWEGAELYGKPLPFRVLDITEYLAEQLRDNKLLVRRTDGATATFHDPCEIGRKGGVMDAPRELLRAMGIEVRELENNRGFAFCCGGGGGVMFIQGANALRYRTMEAKLREIDATGAEQLVTSCAGCRYTFDDAGTHFNWNKSPYSLLELVAQHLEPKGEART